ncbi:MAG: hypothetical protein CME70_23360 [Halobacteriovorax sp.]|nr:hypothetical protein [Halobacteriovorax sp.]|tara:strand:+ start:107863 stop:108138 length:276 start_codon:yes stop_codon:yes gene_type:complete
MSRKEDIESLVLEVLSFYEPMSFELILLDIPDERIAQIPDFCRADLEEALKLLEKKKKVKLSLENEKKEKFWIKVFPKKSILSQIFSYFRR